MVGWRHQLNGHEFAQAPGGGEGQGAGVPQLVGLQGAGLDLVTERRQKQY